MTLIKHDEAVRLERIVRKVFDCGLGGVMGIAEADYLESRPLDAALVIFAPLYRINKKNKDVEDFIEKYKFIFNISDDYKYDKNVVNNYIENLKKLVDEYY